MTVDIRRDREIYSTDGGWFQARWHFSFDHWAPATGRGTSSPRAGAEKLDVTGVDDAELILIEVPVAFRPIGVWAS